MSILYMEEREIYSKLIEIKDISTICSERRNRWIALVNITENSLLNELKLSKKKGVNFSKRESISLTLGLISKLEQNFIKIISKLEFKENIDDKILYKSLTKLELSFPGVEIDIPTKALFIVIAKQFEEQMQNTKQNTP